MANGRPAVRDAIVRQLAEAEVAQVIVVKGFHRFTLTQVQGTLESALNLWQKATPKRPGGQIPQGNA